MSKFKGYLAALGIVPVFCAGVMPSLAGMTSVGAGEGAVDIVAWAGYVERGDSDKSYDWVTGFEKETGCKVSVKVAGTSDEMVSLMNEGGFDLVTASGDASLRLVAGKTVQPINVSLIPSWKTVDPRLQSAPWHTVDGVHYGVPYQWGAECPDVQHRRLQGRRAEELGRGVQGDDPAGRQVEQGPGPGLDGPIYIADAALYLKAHNPELKITDPYELTEPQYKAALDLLRQQKGIVQRYWHDANKQVDDFNNEGVIASSSWPFQVNLLVSQKKPIASVIPSEGATGWADTTMMHAKAKHPNCAYKWLEHSIQAKVQGDVAAWFGSVPAVPAACKGNELLTDDGCKTNGADNFDKIAFWRTPVGQVLGRKRLHPL